ncbi:MAG: nitronate monooxygenase [Candidatus Fermentibacteraceae bacterium]|nr:nitronate monooxygenase [Candidatus Fermentibacteraceae bacterium]MBN2608479.1 nitronate monooxygenase [Candidatus Fermentibacteraceae bacterium]
MPDNCMPVLRIGDLEAVLPIVQGGMGVGISLSGLASAVAEEGGIGVISTAGIGRGEKDFRSDLKAADERALRSEIRRAREKTGGILGVNIMMALTDYDDLLRVSIEEGIDIIFIGAGLPLRLPGTLTLEEFRNCRTKFVPKISSARAAEVILRAWDRHFGRMPDAFAVEGPLAGGHLGFSREDLESGNQDLEDILAQVLSAVSAYEPVYGSIPVIAAGGVYTGSDIYHMLDLGASGVKMGTRFVATTECDAHASFKKAYVDCRREDLVIIDSPVGLPGRAITSRLLSEVQLGEKKPLECIWQCLRTCDVKSAPYCIAKALTSAKLGDLRNGFAFAGANAYLVDRIVSVKELISSLVDEFAQACRAAEPALAIN